MEALHTFYESQASLVKLKKAILGSCRFFHGLVTDDPLQCQPISPNLASRDGWEPVSINFSKSGICF